MDCDQIVAQHFHYAKYSAFRIRDLFMTTQKFRQTIPLLKKERGREEISNSNNCAKMF